MAADIVETDDRIFIDDIPPMKYGENKDNAFIRSVQLSLNALGENFSYEYLMGISGAAFRLHFDPGWCPSSVDPTCGYDVSKVIFESLGYSSDFDKINHHSFEDIKSLYKKIKTQIDLTRPIVAINLMGQMEWGIITGYLKNEPGILCRTFFDKTEEYSLAERAPWLNFFIGEKKQSFLSDDLFLKSMEIAVKLAKTKKFDEYYSGFAAYEKWISKVKQLLDRHNIQDIQHIMEIHFIILNTLLDARRSAFKYLTASDISDKMNNGDKILENYELMVNNLEDASSISGHFKDTFDLKKIIETIKEQADLLLNIYELDKEAIHLIEKDLNI